MAKTVSKKREQVTICTYKDLIEQFHKQSIKMNESMSRRIENFIISELQKEKEDKNDN